MALNAFISATDGELNAEDPSPRRAAAAGTKGDCRITGEKLRDGCSPLAQLTESLRELKTDGIWNTPLRKHSIRHQTPSPDLREFTGIKKFSREQRESLSSSSGTDMDSSPFLQERCSQRVTNSLALKSHAAMQFCVGRISSPNPAIRPSSCENPVDHQKDGARRQFVDSSSERRASDKTNPPTYSELNRMHDRNEKDQRQMFWPKGHCLQYSASHLLPTSDPEMKLINGKQAKALNSSAKLTSLCQLLSSPILENKNDVFTQIQEQPRALRYMPDQENVEPNTLQGITLEDFAQVKSHTFKRARETHSGPKPPKMRRKTEHGDGSLGVSTQRTLVCAAKGESKLSSTNLLEKLMKKEDNCAMHESMESHCETEAVIDTALSRADEHQNLIGDFTRPYVLPLVQSKHHDLVAISSATLAAVITGDYENDIRAYAIVDCRYPYEYEAGHIKGALNIYTKDEIISTFLKSSRYHSNAGHPRATVLIFHCEFSSERGPKLMHFLRNRDRDYHRHSYPKLFYPEIYLLEGGYKDFFGSHKVLCEPVCYKPMTHSDHVEDLRHFRSKSKSWESERPERKHTRVRTSRQLSEEMPSTARRVCRKLP